MADFCRRLIAARQEKGWSQAELARTARVSRGTVIAWETNPHQRHDPPRLARIAAALGKDVSDLEVTGEIEPITTPARLHSWLNQHLEDVINAEVARRSGGKVGAPDNISDISEARIRQLMTMGQAMPVLGDVAAGVPIPAQADVQGYVRFEKDRHYILTVRGDSMIGAGINDGDWVVVDRKEDNWRENEAVVARILQDNETTIKYWALGPTLDTVRLIPDNPAFKETVYPADAIYIDGKVTAVMRPVEAYRPKRRRKSA